MFDYHSLSPRVGEQEVVVERQFSAPRTLMFQVFTQPEHLKCWWAPQPLTPLKEKFLFIGIGLDAAIAAQRDDVQRILEGTYDTNGYAEKNLPRDR